MKIFAFTGKQSNFGDDLNHWMWPQLLPGFFDEDDSVRFIGIGSTLYDSHPAESRKLVFGAGYAGYSALPKINDSWDIRFVRGRNTAKILGLSEDMAVGDSAILIRTLGIPPREKRYETSFMPHFESANQGSWETVCAKAGVHFIDPRWTVDHILDDMLASRLLISEAMHGVIVADALRVPWRAVEPLDPNHRAKWQDWASVLDLDIDFTPLGPSNAVEWVMTHFWQKRRIIYAMRKRRERLRRLGGGIPFYSAVHAMRAMKGSSGQLSPDSAIERATDRMQAELGRLKESYASESQ